MFLLFSTFSRVLGRLLETKVVKSVLVRGNLVICVSKAEEQENYRFKLQGADNIGLRPLTGRH